MLSTNLDLGSIWKCKTLPMQSLAFLMGNSYCEELQCLNRGGAFTNATFQQSCLDNATINGTCSAACREAVRQVEPQCRISVSKAQGPPMQTMQTYERVEGNLQISCQPIIGGCCSTSATPRSKHPTLQLRKRRLRWACWAQRLSAWSWWLLVNGWLLAADHGVQEDEIFTYIYISLLVTCT